MTMNITTENSNFDMNMNFGMEMDMEPTIVNIPVARIDNFEKVARATQRKAKALGEDFEFVKFGSVFTDRVKVTAKVDGRFREFYIAVDKQPYKIEGCQSAKIDGWESIAMIEFTQHGNLIYTKVEGISARYSEVDSVCEHCNKKRSRKMAFVLRNEQGDMIQVGSSCMEDFTGHRSALKLALLYTSVQNLVDEANQEEGWGGFGGFGSNDHGTETVLKIAYSIIKEYGWVSTSSASRNGNTSTASRVYSYTGSSKTLDLSEKDYENIGKAVAWAKGLDSEESYLNNLKVLVSTDMVTNRQIPTLISLFAAYKRAMGISETYEAKKVSEWVGTLGKRQNFTVTLEGMHAFEGYYGWTYIYRFKDEDGNVLVWKSSSDKFWNEVDEDEEEVKMTIKATVKDHSEYKGTKQTELSRVVEAK